MIQLTIRKHCERVGIQNAHQLKLKLKCHIQTATQLWRESLTRMDIDVLDNLAGVFRCSVGEILVRSKKRKTK